MGNHTGFQRSNPDWPWARQASSYQLYSLPLTIHFKEKITQERRRAYSCTHRIQGTIWQTADLHTGRAGSSNSFSSIPAGGCHTAEGGLRAREHKGWARPKGPPEDAAETVTACYSRDETGQARETHRIPGTLAGLASRWRRTKALNRI